MIPQQVATARLALEPLRVSHAPAMVTVLGDPALYAFTGGEPPGIRELTARYERQTAGRSSDGHETWLNWVVTDPAGEPLGYLQATITGAADDAVTHAPDDAAISAHEDTVTAPPDGTGTDTRTPQAELAWVIAASHQGHGYATEAAAAVTAWLREQGVTHLVAHIHPDHRASQAVARHLQLHPTEIVVDGEIRWES
jgi:RimJ/RimL family protein N-acetyltransferase